MYLQENLVELFKLHLKLQGIFGLTNFLIITDKNGKSQLIKCPPRNLQWIKVKLVLLLIFALVIWIQLINGRSKFPLVVLLESLIYCLLSIMFLVMRWAYIKQQDVIVEFFRLIFQFERRHLFSKLTISLSKL